MEETYETHYVNKFKNIGMVKDFTDKEWKKLSVDNQFVVNVHTKTYKWAKYIGLYSNKMCVAIAAKLLTKSGNVIVERPTIDGFHIHARSLFQTLVDQLNQSTNELNKIMRQILCERPNNIFAVDWPKVLRDVEYMEKCEKTLYQKFKCRIDQDGINDTYIVDSKISARLYNQLCIIFNFDHSCTVKEWMKSDFKVHDISEDKVLELLIVRINYELYHHRIYDNIELSFADAVKHISQEMLHLRTDLEKTRNKRRLLTSAVVTIGKAFTGII